jgi:hypothetical protein
MTRRVLHGAIQYEESCRDSGENDRSTNLRLSFLTGALRVAPARRHPFLARCPLGAIKTY